MFDKMSDFVTVCYMNTQTKKEIRVMSRDFFRNPTEIAKRIMRGEHITVTKHGEDFFEVIPKKKHTGQTLADFASLQFSGRKEDKNMSNEVDDIAYGKKV
jgi:antitoxin (DNA-binding transcriptional repressor) of toxin-antitoxin stability system